MQLKAKHAVDVVVCGHLNLMPIAWLLGKRHMAPVVLCIHGIDAWQPTSRPLTNIMARLAHHVLSVSKVTRDRFAAWSGTPLNHISILPNTVHLEGLGPGDRNLELEAKFGLAGRKVILTFGRLDSEERQKGFDKVIEAMPALLAKDPSITYLIAGSGPDRSRLEGKAKGLGVADHCVFTGFVSSEQKADIFRLADVFAMPSKGEGFGIVLLEAMACGVPVVGSTKDGTREALRDGALGILVNPDDIQIVVSGILRGLGMPKVVPEGLAYFDFERFTIRVSKLVDSLQNEI
jgi:glycosyltransferase involved in cell wall biosynthesis